MRFRHCALCIVGLQALVTAVFADPAATEHEAAMRSLTEAYVSTLDNDLVLQASFYTPATRFRDPTSALFGPAWDITGGEQIIEFFSTASEESGTLAVTYKVTDLLVEGATVVANLTATVTACGAGLGYPTKSFTGDIRMVMVLEFEGQKISQRTDYVGYSAAWDYMEAIKPALAAQADDNRCLP